MDQESFETLTLQPETLGDDRLLLVENVVMQVEKFNGGAIGVQSAAARRDDGRAHRACRPGDTTSGNVTKPATLDTGLEESASHSSSRKARRSGCTPRRGSLRDERDGQHRPSGHRAPQGPLLAHVLISIERS